MEHTLRRLRALLLCVRRCALTFGWPVSPRRFSAALGLGPRLCRRVRRRHVHLARRAAHGRHAAAAVCSATEAHEPYASLARERVGWRAHARGRRRRAVVLRGAASARRCVGGVCRCALGLLLR